MNLIKLRWNIFLAFTNKFTKPPPLVLMDETILVFLIAIDIYLSTTASEDNGLRSLSSLILTPRSLQGYHNEPMAAPLMIKVTLVLCGSCGRHSNHKQGAFPPCPVLWKPSPLSLDWLSQKKIASIIDDWTGFHSLRNGVWQWISRVKCLQRFCTTTINLKL